MLKKKKKKKLIIEWQETDSRLYLKERSSKWSNVFASLLFTEWPTNKHRATSAKLNIQIDTRTNFPKNTKRGLFDLTYRRILPTPNKFCAFPPIAEATSYLTVHAKPRKLVTPITRRRFPRWGRTLRRRFSNTPTRHAYMWLYTYIYWETRGDVMPVPLDRAYCWDLLTAIKCARGLWRIKKWVGERQ